MTEAASPFLPPSCKHLEHFSSEPLLSFLSCGAAGPPPLQLAGSASPRCSATQNGPSANEGCSLPTEAELGLTGRRVTVGLFGHRGWAPPEFLIQKVWVGRTAGNSSKFPVALRLLPGPPLESHCPSGFGICSCSLLLGERSLARILLRDFTSTCASCPLFAAGFSQPKGALPSRAGGQAPGC